MPKAELFTIGEFSAMTGVGIHSLRYYDEIGAETAPVLSGSFPRKPAGTANISPRLSAALCRQKRAMTSHSAPFRRLQLIPMSQPTEIGESGDVPADSKMNQVEK